MRRVEFTNEQVKTIIEEYLQLPNMTALGRKYEVDPGVIKRILIENNISIQKPKKHTPQRIIPEEVQDQVVYNYTIKNMSLQKAGAEFSLSQGAVESILKKRGVKKRTYIEAKQLSRKFDLQDDFFKTHTPDMAYILGLLASDGNISMKENGVFIELQREDAEVLEKIRETVGSTRPIDYYTNSRGKELAKFAVWSYNWKNDLKLYGIIPNKTFILEPPLFLCKDFNIDYIRGYFDGDGSIYSREYSSYVQIDGASHKVMNWIRETLATQYGISNSKMQIYTTDNGVQMYRTAYGNKITLKRFYDLFYHSQANLFIERKKKKFETILK